MLAAWRRTSIKLDVPERMAQMLSEAAVSITITSVTDMISFWIGIYNPFPSVQIFCIYSSQFLGLLVPNSVLTLFVFRCSNAVPLRLAPDVLRRLRSDLRLLRAEEPSLAVLLQSSASLQIGLVRTVQLLCGVVTQSIKFAEQVFTFFSFAALPDATAEGTSFN